MKLLYTIHYAAPPKRYRSEDANEPSFFFVYVSKCNRRRYLLDAQAVEGESSERLICTKYSIIIVRRVMTKAIPGKRKRGRPQTRWKDVCKRDMQTVRLREGDEGDRAYWKETIDNHSGELR